MAWRLEGGQERREAGEQLRHFAQDPAVRKRAVFVAWVAGVLVGEFLLPATSPLGQLVEPFLRGAGYEQQHQDRRRRYPSAGPPPADLREAGEAATHGDSQEEGSPGGL